MLSDYQKLNLRPEIRQELLSRAQLSPLKEVCGLLGGQDNHLQSFYTINNIAADPARRFLMDPGEQLRALRVMEQRGEELRAIFHSHTASKAEPSPTDLELALYPGVYHLIASLLVSPPELQAYLYMGNSYTRVELFDPHEGVRDS